MSFLLSKLVYCTLIVAIVSVTQISGDVEDDFIQYSSKNQLTTENGDSRVWWVTPRIMRPSELLNLCTIMSKNLGNVVGTITIDSVFPDVVNVVLPKNEYKGTLADVVACGVANTEKCVHGKCMFYVAKGQFTKQAYCYYLLKPFRPMSVSLQQKACLNKADLENDHNDSGRATFNRRNIFDIDKAIAYSIMQYDRAENEFVTHFGNGESRIVWSIATNADNSWELMHICDQLKRFETGLFEIDEARVQVGNLRFLQEKYRTKSVDLIACGIADTENYIDGKQYIHATKGMYDNSYFLLDRYNDGNFYVNRHQYLGYSPSADHPQYYRIEEEFVKHFGNDKSPIRWSDASGYPESQMLIRTCNRVDWIRRGEVTVESAMAGQITLLFRNQSYESRQSDMISCKIAEMYYVHLVPGENVDCYYSLAHFFIDIQSAFYVDRHFCVKNPDS